MEDFSNEATPPPAEPFAPGGKPVVTNNEDAATLRRLRAEGHRVESVKVKNGGHEISWFTPEKKERKLF